MPFFNFNKVRERLLAMIAEQKSVLEIEQELDTPPGSVPGHLRRNPEPKPYAQAQETPEVKTVQKLRPARGRTSFNGASKPTRQGPKSVMLTEVPVKAEYRVPLHAIRAKGQCRWPVEDDPATPHGLVCCGAPTMGDSVYCASHHMIAYVKPQASGGAFTLQVRKPNSITAQKKVTKENA